MAPRDPGPKNSTGLAPGTRFYSPFPFAGMNTQASPIAISDQEFLWMENFIRLGDGKLRTAWDAGTPLFTAPQRGIVSFFAFSIALEYYFAVFLGDGSAFQVHWPDGDVTTIGPPGTFYKSTNPSALPACVQYGVLYLIISNNNTSNDYWIWDGTLLYESGTVAPNGVNLLANGSNYSSAPNMTVYGGVGSGVGLSATVNAGGVVNIQITNPGQGFEVGDNLQIAFSGGGSDSSAILTTRVNQTTVAAVNITANGTGYTTASASFSGGGGSGAAGTPIISTGSVATLTLMAGGSGYAGGAGVMFSGGGSPTRVASATASVVNGVVVELDIDDGGAGYSSAPSVAITGAGGTGATATCMISANGTIIGVSITNGGTGYTSAPGLTISGDGSGALGTAILTSTGISNVDVVNPGSGFWQPPLIQFIGGGSPTTVATGVTRLTGTSVSKINVLAGGQNYGNPSGNEPTISILGGLHGTGATAVISEQSSGSIEAVQVTNGGQNYKTLPLIALNIHKGDGGVGASFSVLLTPTTLDSVVISVYGQNYTESPGVQILSGSNNAAYATIGLMPFGLSGTAMETYLQRVWIAHPAPSPFDNLPPQGDFAVTAPGSVTDVATSDGGVLFTNSDSFLQTKYVGIKQSNGYLYFVGDGSCSVVSGVNTASITGSSVTTTFNYQTIDPQVGGSWRDAIQDFGRNILIANETGVFSIVGGAATKASDKMDDIFLNAAFPPISGALTPSAALAHVFNVKHYFMLATIMDKDENELRNVMLTFNGREWSITSQTPNLTYIGPQKRGSQFFAWGTDGSSLYPLFNVPSTTLRKRLDTKLFGANDPITTKEVVGFYIQAQDQSANEAGVVGSVALAASGAVSELGESTPNQLYTDPYVLQESNNQMGVLLQQPDFQAPEPAWPVFGTQTAGIPAMNVGVRFSTRSPDFVLSHMLLSYRAGPPLA